MFTKSQKQRIDYVFTKLFIKSHISRHPDVQKDTKHLLQSLNSCSSKTLQGLCYENGYTSSSGDGPESHHGLQSSFH